MDKIRFKLEFETSQLTNINRETLSNRIIQYLKEKNYSITCITDQYIEFNNYGGSLGASYKEIDKIQEGKINLDNMGEEKVTLKYYIPYKDIIFISLAIVVWSLIMWTPVYLLLFVFILFVFLLTIVAKKSTANSLMKEILKEDSEISSEQKSN